MPHALILAHMQNTRYIHGGAIYRESIRAMLTTLDPTLAVDEIFVHPQHNRLWRVCRQVFDILWSQFSKYPAKVNHFRTQSFRSRLASSLAVQPYSLFVINGAEMLWTLDLLPKDLPILFISHNIEHRLYEQQVARYDSVPCLGRLLRADAEKFKRFEIDHLRRVNTIITITDEDRKVLHDFCPEARIATILPSFDYQTQTRTISSRTGPLRLGFLGNLEWWPNSRSLQWFLDKIWPQVSSGLELHLYGQGSAALDDGRRIFGHGFVRDLSQVWSGVDLMIQPITCGAGINVKVAESIYNRMPIVATPLALRGIMLHKDPAIKVLAEAHEWITYLNSPEPAILACATARQDNADLFSLSKNAVILKTLLTTDRTHTQGNSPWPR